MNRPVHLALRDACTERAVEMLSLPMHPLGTEERIAHVDRVIALLRMSTQHARLAARSARAGERERDFLHFLRLTLQHVESVYALIQNQAHMESREHSFLTKFLSVGMQEVSLTAINYRRQAEDMLEGLWHVLRLSSAPYRELQQANFTELSKSEQERYHRARAGVQEELSAGALPTFPETGPEPLIRNAAPPPPSGTAEFSI
jgi:hypothetical protein